jgi:hypothetical protein
LCQLDALQLDETTEALIRVQKRENEQAEEAKNLRRRLEDASDLEELARRSRTVISTRGKLVALQNTAYFCLMTANAEMTIFSGRKNNIA